MESPAQPVWRHMSCHVLGLTAHGEDGSHGSAGGHALLDHAGIDSVEGSEWLETIAQSIHVHVLQSISVHFRIVPNTHHHHREDLLAIITTTIVCRGIASMICTNITPPEHHSTTPTASPPQ